MLRSLFLALALLARQDDRFPELLRQLGDDVVEVREKAAADLLRLGERRRSDLEKAASEASSPEIAGRIRGVIEKLDAEKRRREYKGGKIVDDLGLRVTCSYDRKARVLTVDVELSNFGTVERKIVDIQDWNVKMPLAVVNAGMPAGLIQVTQITGTPVGDATATTTVAASPPRWSFRDLNSGEHKTFTHRIDASSLSPGEHELKVTYFGKRLTGLSGDLTSNAEKFKVED